VGLFQIYANRILIPEEFEHRVRIRVRFCTDFLDKGYGWKKPFEVKQIEFIKVEEMTI
jgi:hypothetical protein